ncbi:4988_t:CDS:2, partial [Entrophospora sp. SA101]
KRNEIYGQEVANEVQTLIILARWIQAEIDKLSKKYPEPLMGQLEILSLVVEQQAPLLTLDLENAGADIMKKVRMTPEEGIPVDDIIELYREILSIKILYEHHCNGSKFAFGIEAWFGPYIKKWLDATNNKTPEWSAKFMTNLSKIISKALEQYCSVIEEIYQNEMAVMKDPEQETSKQSAWYVNVKTAIATQKSCIKLNNIEAAREQLDKLYDSMGVDYLTQILNESTPPTLEPVEVPKYFYTIKIVMAENLAALDNNGLSDPYCIISDKDNNILARTRVIYESLNPRWDEAFDLTIDSTDQNWLTLTIWDSDQVSSDDECGKTYFKLDPQDYSDYLAHDIWLDLDPQGRIFLRISMEGEKDDLQFYFGKTFRTLKRAHDDMARTIMSPFLRQCLSREVINRLLRPSASAFKHFFRESDVQTKKSDLEIEQAIHPLFDYFDVNLKTLFHSLHPAVFKMVMTRVWKEIETILEEILIPPLSDKPSDLKPLNDEELEVVYKWLKFLGDYLHANGNGVSKEEVLFNLKYHEIMKIQYYYVMDKESLKQDFLQIKITSSLNPKKKSLSASKSVLHQRNLGTIKHRKSEKRKHNQHDDGEIILRILRMHPGTKAFLKEQMEERAKKIQSKITPVVEGGVDTIAEN